MKKPETVLAWAWEIKDPNGEWRLCRWSQPFKSTLTLDEKPSDEARKVCVRMVRNKERP